jgi:hypothetical protein
MRLFSAYGMIEVDDAVLSPHGPLAPDPEQVRAAEASWNAPPPDYVTVRTTVGPIRPVPKEYLTFIRQCVAAVGLELGNRYRLDVQALWPILSGARPPSAEMAAAIGRAALRLQGELGLRADDERLACLRKISGLIKRPDRAPGGVLR